MKTGCLELLQTSLEVGAIMIYPKSENHRDGYSRNSLMRRINDAGNLSLGKCQIFIHFCFKGVGMKGRELKM